MKRICKTAAVLLVGIAVSGCRHRTQATPPQAAQAPIAPASTYAKNSPPPQMPPPKLEKVTPAPKPAPSTDKPKPHKASRHKSKPSTEQQEQPTAEQNSEHASNPAGSTAPAETAPTKEQTSTEVASNSPPSDASPIGPLSEPGSSITSPRRNQVLDEINSTEKGLNDIKRPLNPDEQTTATQIRTFITKAKEALNQEDLDGANTLITKAKVLLDELAK